MASSRTFEDICNLVRIAQISGSFSGGSLAVSDALNNGHANDATLQNIAARHQPVLGSIAIVVRIRVAVQSTPIVLEDGQVVHITVSIGGAMYRAGEADLQEALKRADAALYSAKQAGRNRVVLDVRDDGTRGPQDGGEDRKATVPAAADA